MKHFLDDIFRKLSKNHQCTSLHNFIALKYTPDKEAEMERFLKFLVVNS